MTPMRINDHYYNQGFYTNGIWIPYFSLFFLIILCALSSNAEMNLSGKIESNVHWSLSDSPVLIQGNLEIPKGVEVVADAGVEVKIAEKAVITVLGNFTAEGTVDTPIRFLPNGEKRWGAISYEKEGTGLLKHCYFDRGSYASDHRNGVVNAYKCAASVVIDSCTFTRWPDEFDAKATNGYQATKMVVRYCYFGEGISEAVYGVESPMLVEYNTIEPRHDYRDAIDIGTTQNPGPIIRYNICLGSEDDAIDLDDCDAYVEGNLVMNCRGGVHDPIGISGDKTSKPIIVNNVIINCESGIGFKNGANITCYNNTIINCDKGIWMHQNPAHATVYNTIIWGSDDQISIKLEPGSTIDISYSIIKGATVYEGEGNANLDPLFVDLANLNLNLTPGSPAIDAGWSGEGVLDYDFLRLPRVNKVDIGAYEYQAGTGITKWLWLQ